MAIFSVAIYIKRKRQARRIEMSRYESSIAELERARQELCAMNEQQQMEMSRLIDKKKQRNKKSKKRPMILTCTIYRNLNGQETNFATLTNDKRRNSRA